ncbi:rRNA maturation RNase YbeY [Halalkalibacterium halodurans]|uniref:rRNA maturation RNase YbeY n=1 Tax=Halalkalibacterium halodurans TaxID=86665 RepID=UPI002AA9C5DB|nr:rRNA maturation RNase YbeY [Halalkalibacterium halodurans]MDY7221888.1 rRNA maturation RNase YbeY [Halalkalibacterium halodurans]MDY7241164.1 rRNA maturation RNase YbeY [Halalkalibacterium halodurans]
MNIQIDMIDHTDTLTEKQETLIRELLHEAARYEELAEGTYELSLSFVSDEEIQELNRDYRGKDQPTDVISFALNEVGEGEQPVEPEAGTPNLLGDIIVSIPRCQEQAEAYGHSFERELGFLIVHGFLHLLGYDHMSEDEEKKMFMRQEDILTAYGLTRS